MTEGWLKASAPGWRDRTENHKRGGDTAEQIRNSASSLGDLLPYEGGGVGGSHFHVLGTETREKNSCKNNTGYASAAPPHLPRGE